MNPFSKTMRGSVAELGEEKLIMAIRRWLGSASPPAPYGIGDDCALLPARAGRQLLTVDPVIYGRHFDRSDAATDVGAKLLKRNLSDIAAMGGQPEAAVVALTIDRRTSLRWLEQFYRGLANAARKFGVPVVGGDVAQADGIVAGSLTLLGRPAGPRVLTRAGARTGDWIYVTGVLGGSVRSGHHLTFTPRLAEGAWLSRQGAVRALMDVSDGLAKDLRAITPAGSMSALEPKRVPRRAGSTLRAALSDGEDYELVFAVAERADREAFERAWKKAFPRTRVSCIGRFVPDGQLPAGCIDLRAYHGYEHLKA